MQEYKYAATPPSNALSNGERCAQRTLAAARRLLNPQEVETASTVEAELAMYVREAYQRRSYG